VGAEEGEEGEEGEEEGEDGGGEVIAYGGGRAADVWSVPWTPRSPPQRRSSSPKIHPTPSAETR